MVLTVNEGGGDDVDDPQLVRAVGPGVAALSQHLLEHVDADLRCLLAQLDAQRDLVAAYEAEYKRLRREADAIMATRAGLRDEGGGNEQ